MAFTTSSTVSNVIISVFDDFISGKKVILDGDDAGTVISFDLDDGYPASGTTDRTNLEILQTIYNSDDGFQDTDGNSITVNVRGRYDNDVPEELSENGWWNPLARRWRR